MYNRIHFLNTFAIDGFGGSPAAVYFSHRPIESEAMQLLAKELPVPVTAFVWKEKKNCRIRYFTTHCEIAACGHATLGAAVISSKLLQADAVSFSTASETTISAVISGGDVSMTYAPQLLFPTGAEDELLHSLSLSREETTEVYRYQDTLIIVLRDAQRVRQLQPNIRRLHRSSSVWEEVVVTAASNDNDYDYVLRSFCPWIGIDEDPATGSVQAALAPFWGKRSGKRRLKAYQASARGGELFLSLSDDVVHIGGKCTVLSSLN